MQYFINLYYLCLCFGVAYPNSRVTMKRESGESPEQTRCCKSDKTLYRTLATDLFREGCTKGISQKTCQH